MINLFPYQQPSAENLLRSLREHRVAVDASDTGTGKTYVAAWILAQSEKQHSEQHDTPFPVVVVCPKAVIPVWQRILKEAGLTHVCVVNYEKLRNGSTPLGKSNVKKWEWTISEHTVIVFDEVHRCKSPTSQNARILAASKPYRVLALSATLAQDPTDMRAIGYLLGLHNYTNFFKWCLKNGCWKGPFGGIEFKKKSAHKHLTAIHNEVFPGKGSRIRIADLGDAFPDNFVTAEVYAFGNEDAVNDAYDAVYVEQCRRIEKGEPENVGALQMQARAKAETIKADGLAAMAKDLIEEGNSVVIFTSFRETLTKLCEKLKCQGVYGGQNEKQRQMAINTFQVDSARVIVVNIAAGGVGISLHDLNGTYPRVSLICPTFHAVDLKQALGRIHRAGAKSKAVQKIVFAADTIEESICRRVQKKIDNIDLLNNGDLDPLAEGARDTSGTPNPAELGSNPKLRASFDPEPDIPVEVCEAASRLGQDPAFRAICGLAQTNDLSSNSSPNEQFDLQVSDTSVGCGTVMPVKVNETPNNSTPDNESVSTRRHAPLSPSTLKARAICPGFRNDPNGDPTARDRGTLGHRAIELEDLSLVAHDAALKSAVEKCIQYKHYVARDKGIMQEVRLDYFDQWGFADVLVFGGPVLDIIDWKFAVNLYAANSPQFWCYGIGGWDKYPHINTVRVHAVHPFRDEIDIETWTRSKDYSRISGMVAAAIRWAKNKHGDLSAYNISEQCAYCGFAGKCGKLANTGLEIARRYAPELNLPAGSLHGSEITNPNDIATLLRIKPAVEKALSGWSKAGLDLWDTGIAIPGFEIAHRSGRRSIASAKAAYEAVQDKVPVDQFLEACSVSPTALEDLYAAAHPRGQKGKAKEVLEGLLVDQEILTTGGDSRHLRQIRK